jgi:hypothetical protein
VRPGGHVVSHQESQSHGAQSIFHEDHALAIQNISKDIHRLKPVAGMVVADLEELVHRLDGIAGDRCDPSGATPNSFLDFSERHPLPDDERFPDGRHAVYKQSSFDIDERVIAKSSGFFSVWDVPIPF